MEMAMFGAGCFWGVESEFRRIPGVTTTEAGYSGGHYPNPSYEDVCLGITGHAEVVRVQYRPSEVSYNELLSVFWMIHDPTQLNRQGPDIGTQYRSVIFCFNDSQLEQALASRKEREESGSYKYPITTDIRHASEFYLAEEYHQRYFEKRGAGAMHC